MTSKLGSSESDRPDRGPSTTVVHAGEERLKPGFAMTDPIFCTSTYTFPNTQAVIDYAEDKRAREE